MKVRNMMTITIAASSPITSAKFFTPLFLSSVPPTKKKKRKKKDKMSKSNLQINVTMIWILVISHHKEIKLIKV